MKLTVQTENTVRETSDASEPICPVYHEINVAKSLDYQPGSMICMDRGYTDYDWWKTSRKKAFFS